MLPLGSPSFGQDLKGLEKTPGHFPSVFPGACGLTTELLSRSVPAAFDPLVLHSGKGYAMAGCAPPVPGLW